MLMQLGSVVFEIAPIGLDEIDHAGDASYARHPVLGAMPPLEFTGEGSEGFRIRGTLLPEFSLSAIGDDGQSDVNALHAMRRSGNAQFLMRGDGHPLGWVAIQRVTERSRNLNAAGVGRVIDVTIDCTVAQKPEADGFEALLNLMTFGF